MKESVLQFVLCNLAVILSFIAFFWLIQNRIAAFFCVNIFFFISLCMLFFL